MKIYTTVGGSRLLKILPFVLLMKKNREANVRNEKWKTFTNLEQFQIYFGQYVLYGLASAWAISWRRKGRGPFYPSVSDHIAFECRLWIAPGNRCGIHSKSVYNKSTCLTCLLLTRLFIYGPLCWPSENTVND